MQITLNEDEIHEAVEAYVRGQIALAPNQKIGIKFTAGRGENGLSATLDIRTQMPHSLQETPTVTSRNITATPESRGEAPAEPVKSVKAPAPFARTKPIPVKDAEPEVVEEVVEETTEDDKDTEAADAPEVEETTEDKPVEPAKKTKSIFSKA